MQNALVCSALWLASHAACRNAVSDLKSFWSNSSELTDPFLTCRARQAAVTPSAAGNKTRPNAHHIPPLRRPLRQVLLYGAVLGPSGIFRRWRGFGLPAGYGDSRRTVFEAAMMP
ncbi:hypothetical protein Vretimale_17148 [Volvox reticuliferus]|uniref:Secreted protein n=1 Tax=Volvox reticuliferus TaxID=1737510 RepID=A0A8J4GV46_9CHLO|nr:hypothetical protein Vretimale_17148 [Volvox reticuliferus]